MRLSVTGMTPMLPASAASVPTDSAPYQVSPASSAGSSQKTRMSNGSPPVIGPSGPVALMLPASPPTTAVTRSVVSTLSPSAAASQFCTSTHQSPASGSAMSHDSAEPQLA